ncbi:hypothetical protein CC1G_14263 [Coprinopsis cinerea okayama7|uniref:F-box domain-containing protein n=1 Tax=Coprinopsis cinerea (strain Okayama-7 / 130 / ATCC MYA-4618 / FGSC 9003) TaxID=240176 RepID=D6RLF4_COPC7|nr:hypothetical protein CC1G_14263 [Coprinopsis cinerea okayama7\|eukprot:XP_002911732.1 hypothetical protein CC1G_14263 [Coprinopsis cinerea okayama7\
MGPAIASLLTPRYSVTTPVFAMHRCLGIPEIQSNISGILQDKDEVGLARWAGTCRLFHKNAIPHLWRNIPGLYVIANLLPDCFSDFNGELFLKENAPISKHLPRLREHTNYVKLISYYEARYDDVDIDPPMLHWSALHLLLEDHLSLLPLFPNVQEVVIPFFQEKKKETIFYSAFLTSPNLRSVTVLTDEVFDIYGINKTASNREDAHVISLVTHLSSFAPNLLSFGIDGPYHEQPVWERHTAMNCLNGVLPSFSDALRSLHIIHLAVNDTDIATLSRLRGLEELEFLINEATFDAHSPHPPSPSPGFPALRSLDIMITDATASTTFFCSFEIPHLQSLSITYGLFGGEEELGDVMRGVSCGVGHSSLTSLMIREVEIEPGFGESDGPSAFLIVPTTLQPLTAFQNLESFTITPCRILQAFANDNLAELLESWPQLERFSVEEDSWSHTLSATTVTLQGVQAAVQHCPKLTYLHFPCDARQVPPLLGSVPPHPSLAHWNVSHSPVHSSHDIVEWIPKVLPHLRNLDYFVNAREMLRIYCDPRWTERKNDLEEVPEDFLMAVSKWNGVVRELHRAWTTSAVKVAHS